MTEREFHFSDFTVAAYRGLLASAADNYRFEPFGTAQEAPHVLWRHDVDKSMHRALRLAEVEADAGVRATYFIWLHSDFYSVLERPVLDLAKKIASQGHWIGLHFDADFYGGCDTHADLVDRLGYERGLLSDWIGVPIDSFSYHQPEIGEMLRFDDDEIAGMANAYGHTVSERYEYVSDSNGYWRFSRLADVLASAQAPRLQVLTHPEWWQEKEMSPRDRIARAADGRRDSQLAAYDALLEKWGRENVR